MEQGTLEGQIVYLRPRPRSLLNSAAMESTTTSLMSCASINIGRCSIWFTRNILIDSDGKDEHTRLPETAVLLCVELKSTHHDLCLIVKIFRVLDAHPVHQFLGLHTVALLPVRIMEGDGNNAIDRGESDRPANVSNTKKV